jgi:hypothetical protein
MLHEVGLYTNNVLGAVLGRSEGFYDKNETTSYSMMGAYSVVVFVGILILIVANLYGAARLSWCYNTFYGTTGFLRFFWSFLCFFNSGLYYPFYAIFLDPVCGRVAQVGGRRQRP